MNLAYEEGQKRYEQELKHDCYRELEPMYKQSGGEETACVEHLTDIFGLRLKRWGLSAEDVYREWRYSRPAMS
jgi:hypothetical protein